MNLTRQSISDTFVQTEGMLNLNRNENPSSLFKDPDSRMMDYHGLPTAGLFETPHRQIAAGHASRVMFTSMGFQKSGFGFVISDLY